MKPLHTKVPRLNMRLTQKVVVEDHSKLGQLHRACCKFHGQHVPRRGKAVSCHPEVAPDAVHSKAIYCDGDSRR